MDPLQPTPRQIELQDLANPANPANPPDPANHNVVFFNRHGVRPVRTDNILPHVKPYVERSDFFTYQVRIHDRKAQQSFGAKLLDYEKEIAHLIPSIEKIISDSTVNSTVEILKIITEFVLCGNHFANGCLLLKMDEDINRNIINLQIQDAELSVIVASISKYLNKELLKESIGAIKNMVSLIISAIEKISGADKTKEALQTVCSSLEKIETDLQSQAGNSECVKQLFLHGINFIPLVYKLWEESNASQKRGSVIGHIGIFENLTQTREESKELSNWIIDGAEIDFAAALYVLCKRYIRERMITLQQAIQDPNNPARRPALDVLRILLKIENDQNHDLVENGDTFLGRLYDSQSEDAFTGIVDEMAKKIELSLCCLSLKKLVNP